MMFAPPAPPDVLLLTPTRHHDERGWFCETFSESASAAKGLPQFVQDNESFSLETGTLRGLHFQRAPHVQAKLVRCVSGAIFDVAVDIRPDSPTFGRHVAHRLTPESGRQLFIPAGFAHGFCTLAPNTLVQYKVSAPYAPSHQGGIAWNDPALGIEWPIAPACMSDRDRRHPPLSQAVL